MADCHRTPALRRGSPAPGPALELQDGATLTRLVGVMQRLLAPDGCPWDREQTFETLRKYVLEEACEVIDAIDARRPQGAPRGARRPAPPGRLPGGAGARARERSRSTTSSPASSRSSSTGTPTSSATSTRRTPTRCSATGSSIKAKREEGERGSSAACRGACLRSRARSASARRSARVGFDWPDARGSRAKVDRGARRARSRRSRAATRRPSRTRWATCSSRW